MKLPRGNVATPRAGIDELMSNAELRDMVYDYSLSYDGIQKVILSDTYDKVGTSTAEDAGFLQTPVILLLDKETSSEAIECLRKKELIFTSPVRCGRALILDHVIPRRAFNNIRRIRFAMPEIQILKNYCDCVEQEDIFEEEEDDDEKEEKEQEEEKAKENRKTDIDLTTYLPLWVQLLEGLFKQFLGSASGSCMVGQIWLQVGAEVLVIRGETIFQLVSNP